MNKQITILIIFSIFSFYTLNAQKPSWTDAYQRQSLYPLSEYLTGFSSELNKLNEPENDLLNRLLESAKLQLVDQIQVTIESRVTLGTDVTDTKTHQVFKQASVSFSKASITGMTTEKYYDRQKKEAFAFVYAKKSDLKNYYQKLVDNYLLEIEQRISDAKQYIKTNDKQKALKAYRECYILFDKYKQDQSTLLALDNVSTLEGKGVGEYEVQVNNAVTKLLQSEQLTLDDVCAFMASELRNRLANLDGSIGIENFTYEGTKIVTEFSRRFASQFPSKLIKEGFQISMDNPTNTNNSIKKTCDLMLYGTFWVEGSHLKIIANLKNIREAKLLAVVEGFLPISWLSQEHVAINPPPNDTLDKNIKVFAKNEIVNGGIIVDLYTNKGQDNLLFTEGDTLKLFVKANHECYLRLIYYLADNKIVLFRDNFYISPSSINKIIPLNAGPDQVFICAPPFGFEILQLNAQTERFKPLKTNIVDGYEYILDDVNQIVANNRSMQRIGDQKLNAEKRIIFTTMAK